MGLTETVSLKLFEFHRMLCEPNRDGIESYVGYGVIKDYYSTIVMIYSGVQKYLAILKTE